MKESLKKIVWFLHNHKHAFCVARKVKKFQLHSYVRWVSSVLSRFSCLLALQCSLGHTATRRAWLATEVFGIMTSKGHCLGYSELLSPVSTSPL